MGLRPARGRLRRGLTGSPPAGGAPRRPALTVRRFFRSSSVRHRPRIIRHIAAETPRPRRLHLGCGRDLRAGYWNVDRLPLPGVDLVLDLEFPLPFRDGAFAEIFSSHVLEHVDRFLPLMAELHRVCAPGGRLRLFVPHLSFFGSYTDPTHRRFFGYHSFDYLAEGDYNFYTPVRFRIVEREIRFYWINNAKRRVRGRLLTWLFNRAPLVYERFLCWMLPANELYFELEPAPSSRAATRGARPPSAGRP